jgi:Ser/Thr protein kinase RdoA (MazF antagonist)
MQLEHFLADCYGLTGTLSRLGGDMDANYLFEGSFGRLIFKVMHPSFDQSVVEMQVAALDHLSKKDQPFEVPKVIKSLSGDALVRCPSPEGTRIGWMISHLGGTLMAKAPRPWPLSLNASLGTQLAKLDAALADFQHPSLTRPFHWDILQAHWLKDKLTLHKNPQRQAIIKAVYVNYQALYKTLQNCPRCVTHHDANDMNLFVGGPDAKPEICGFIDFGDLIYSARIGELAIAAAYTVMDTENPLESAAALLAAYHEQGPLTETEIEIFFPLMCARLAVTVTNSAERVLTEPDDPYLVLHSAPAWRLLERFHGINMDLVKGYFRRACGMATSATSDAVGIFLKRSSGNFSSIFKGLSLESAYHLDLSVGAPIPANAPVSADTKALNKAIKATMQEAGANIAIGGYGEERPIYSGSAFGGTKQSPNVPKRSHHLGVDITVPTGTVIYAPQSGTIWSFGNAADKFDYGGYVILAHLTDDNVKFYSLYGHLAPSSISHLKKGALIKAGGQIGAIGEYSENGGWWPHLHLQLLTEMPSTDGTPPGACEKLLFPSAVDLYPNPAAFLNLAGDITR